MSVEVVAIWEIQRAKGKWLFVLKRTLLCALSMFALTALETWPRASSSEFEIYFLNLCLILGFLVGMSDWWMKDARYLNHILDKKIHAGLKF